MVTAGAPTPSPRICASALASAAGVWLGFPLADPIVGLLIALAIMRIVWQSAGSVFNRAIDGVGPEVVGEIHEAPARTPGVGVVTRRWSAGSGAGCSPRSTSRSHQHYR